MPDTRTPGISAVGHQVRTALGNDVVGVVEDVAADCVRVHKIPGHPGRVGYVPEQAIEYVDPWTNTARLRAGIEVAQVLDAPRPTGASATGACHKRTKWWSDLLGHYGLYASEGRASEPFLHPDQR
jgi:hypothetical protein